MFCIKCGTELPEDALFCCSCGTAVYKKPTVKTPASKAIKSKLDKMFENMEDTRVYTVSNCDKFKKIIKDKLKSISFGKFFYLHYITLADGNSYGFKYGHTPELRGEQDFYYNLYNIDPQGNYRFLGCGSRGGVENLTIYKNYIYWEYIRVYRYDLNTGEFISSDESWLKDEYKSVRDMATKELI